MLAAFNGGWWHHRSRYLYLWSTFVVTQKLAPIKFGKVLGNLKALYSSYRQSLSRLITNQEAVAALKGAEVEKDIITTRFDAVMTDTAKYNRVSLWHSFVNQLGFQWWLRSFVGLFVIGPHVYYPSVTDLSSLENIAKLRGNIGHEFVLFVQSMIAAGLTAKMAKNVAKLEGSAGRVNVLIKTLRKMRLDRRLNPRSLPTNDDFIEFKEVKVQTPTKVTLVEKLNFRLNRGDSILITGHNGAGKSSIFRCLGGLWDVPEGEITKPGSASSGLHQDVFYLPQKPYNVIGTLYDQLTYPESGAGSNVTVEMLTDIMDRVDLRYLVSAPGVLTDDINWEERLSLGEKQRLAMARLIYHKPKFAILDECTSAVSGQMEYQLYEICKELKVTYITISHRPTLKAFHNQILTIGDGKQGYTLEAIDHTSMDKSKTTYNTSGANDGGAQGTGGGSGGGGGAAAGGSSPGAAASVASQAQAPKQIKHKGTWQRLQRLVQLGLPGQSALTSIGGIIAAI